MLQNIKKITVVLVILSSLPVLSMADLSKSDQAKISEVCKSALTEKGYDTFEYKYVEILRAQSGNYGMTGQLHKEGKHFEFTCFFNKDLKKLTLEEFVVEPLGK